MPKKSTVKKIRTVLVPVRGVGMVRFEDHRTPPPKPKKRKLVRFLSVLQTGPITNFPGFHIKEDDRQHVHTPVAVVMLPQGHQKPGDNGYDRQAAHAELLKSAPDLLRACRLAEEFLASLPTGWLGKTSGDIGALNQFYLTSKPLLKKLEIFAD
jgi:hypothetical protein